MTTEAIIGLIASILTAVCMLPQLVKIVRSKRAQEISWLMLATLLGGVALWTVYGFMKEDYFIVASNGFSLVLNITLMILSLKYKKNDGNHQPATNAPAE